MLGRCPGGQPGCVGTDGDEDCLAGEPDQRDAELGHVDAGSGAGRTAPAPAPGVIVPICLSGVCASSPAQADPGCAGASRVRWTRTQPAARGGGGLVSGGGSLARCTVLVPGGGLSSLTSLQTSACALSGNPPAEAVAECGELTATVAGAAAELQPASSTNAAVAAVAGHVRIVASRIPTRRRRGTGAARFHCQLTEAGQRTARKALRSRNWPHR